MTVWKSAYKRGLAMQAPLALLSSILSSLAAWQTQDLRWLFGAIILLTNWPYTLLVVGPVNRRLKGINSASAGSESRMLIERWGQLHRVRSALGVAAILVFLWSSMNGA